MFRHDEFIALAAELEGPEYRSSPPRKRPPRPGRVVAISALEGEINVLTWGYTVNKKAET